MSEWLDAFGDPLAHYYFYFKDNNFRETGRYEMNMTEHCCFVMFVKIDEDDIVQKDNLPKKWDVRLNHKVNYYFSFINDVLILVASNSGEHEPLPHHGQLSL